MTSYSDDDAPWYFYRTSITSVVIKEGATSIGSNAFYGCTNLTSVDLGESVTSITIPLSVTSIGSYAFYNCTSLTYVYYAGSEEDWDEISIGTGNTYLTSATIKCTE